MNRDLASDDCRLHPPPRGWRESFFWGFCTRDLWGQFNIAFHYDPPRTDRYIVLARPGQPTLALVDIDPQAPPEIETMRRKGYHCLEPLREWRFRLDANFIQVPHGADIPLHYQKLLQAGELEQASLPVSIDVLYEETTPPYAAEWRFLGEPVEHYQSSGRYRGTIQIGQQRLTLDGLGPRDHSWGRRDWLRPQWWYLLTFDLEDGAVHIVTSQTVDGYRVEDGFVLRGDHLAPIRRVEISPQADPQDGHVIRSEIRFATAEQEFSLTTTHLDFFHMSVQREGEWLCHCAETLSTIEWQGHYFTGVLEHGHRRKVEM